MKTVRINHAKERRSAVTKNARRGVTVLFNLTHHFQRHELILVDDAVFVLSKFEGLGLRLTILQGYSSSDPAINFAPIRKYS